MDGPGAVSGDLHALEVLDRIARLLNSRADVEAALDEVLALVVRLLRLRTAWLFLSAPHGRRLGVTAAHALPPALSAGEWRPLRRGLCECFRQFYDGKLREAVNIVQCSRLDEARGDRQGLVYHASVPLKGTSGTLGILNVASPGRALFDPAALHLLTAAGEHLGTALERSRLFVRERQRARLFEAVERVSRALAAGSPAAAGAGAADDAENALAEVAGRFAEACVDALGVDAVSVALGEEELRLAAAATARGCPGSRPGSPEAQGHTLAWRAGVEVPGRSLLGLAWRFGKLHLGSAAGSRRRRLSVGVLDTPGSWAAVPVRVGSRRVGAILIERWAAVPWPEAAEEALRALGAHLALALESCRLRIRARELARQEERHRMARQLHDAVSQELFSLTMVLAAARHAARGGDPGRLQEALGQGEVRARAALEEMRRLVHELRPRPGRHRTVADLAAALGEFVRYHPLARGDRVQVRVEGPRRPVGGTTRLSAEQFETMWMVGREAVHNALRHAGARTVCVRLGLPDGGLRITVADDGAGFDVASVHSHGTGHGLSIMAERCALAGGWLRLKSKPGRGTVAVAWVPLRHQPAAPFREPVEAGG
ncbi:GAF domain-containing sensor histidine kinase [Carboxydochorda subterranea]|uniref:Oxygen sensor histidine kinase NreB n=1 Tax=Carboxydichorda subterranea TaxID=3109565 RepID=A0ABZ1BZE5_9FIRM|nr:GAF domain-containing sensor histidine kinase [Limnochorda sp. L945t]WRP18109.1 GAF domain-containing sensor histidine kinase [Limnochorda sp. L945t]